MIDPGALAGALQQRLLLFLNLNFHFLFTFDYYFYKKLFRNKISEIPKIRKNFFQQTSKF